MGNDSGDHVAAPFSPGKLNFRSLFTDSGGMRKVPYRKAALYLGAALVAVSLAPWNGYTEESPPPRRLSAGLASDSKPLSYESEGLPTGFDRAFLDRLCEILRIPVDYRMIDGEHAREALSSGRVDLIPGMIATETLRESLDFTVPYISDEYRLYVNRASGIASAGDLSGRRIALRAGDGFLENWVSPAGFEGQLQVWDSFAEAFASVDRGEADCTAAPLSIGQSLLKSGVYPGVLAQERPLLSAELRVGVRKGNPELVSLLNEGISRMLRDHELDRLRSEWKLPDLSSPFSSVKPVSIFLSAIVSLAAAFVIGLVWIVLDYFIARRHLGSLRSQVRFLETVLGALPFGLRWESLDNAVQGENRLYRVFGAEGGGKSVSKRLIEISTLMNAPLGRLTLLEDNARVQELESRLRQLHRELAEKNSLIVEQSIVDPVSGLFNRSYMKSRILGLLESSRRGGEGFSLLTIGWIDACSDPFTIRSAARRLKGCLGVHDVAGIDARGCFIILFPGVLRSELPGIADRITAVIAGDDDDRETERVCEFLDSSDTILMERITHGL